METPTERLWKCGSCGKEWTGEDLVAVRKCKNRNCGATYNGSANDRDCPECGSDVTTKATKRGCPECVAVEPCIALPDAGLPDSLDNLDAFAKAGSTITLSPAGDKVGGALGPTRSLEDTYKIMAIADIQIGDRFREDLGNIDELAESFERVGMLRLIVVDSSGRLISGRRAIEAQKRRGATHVPVLVAWKVTDELIRIAELNENTHRKNLNRDELKRALKLFYDDAKAKAKERQRVHGHSAPGRKGNTPSEESGVKVESGEALELLAKRVGISKSTARKLLRDETEPKSTSDLALGRKLRKALETLLPQLKWFAKSPIGIPADDLDGIRRILKEVADLASVGSHRLRPPKPRLKVAASKR